MSTAMKQPGQLGKKAQAEHRHLSQEEAQKRISSAVSGALSAAGLHWDDRIKKRLIRDLVELCTGKGDTSVVRLSMEASDAEDQEALVEEFNSFLAEFTKLVVTDNPGDNKYVPIGSMKVDKEEKGTKVEIIFRSAITSGGLDLNPVVVPKKKHS